MATCRARKNRENNKKIVQNNGTGVDCSCCYDAYAFQDMIPCKNEGHLFCVDCVKSFAENQIFGAGNLGVDAKSKKPALELQCFHADGCGSGFHRSYLEKALPSKTMKKYDEIQFQISVEQAGLDELGSCPKCEFQALVPATQKLFLCPVVGCGFESCRECGEESHIPLR